MTQFLYVAACSALVMSQPSAAQESVSSPLPPVVAQPASGPTNAVLPSNTEVTLAMNSDLTTKGGRIEEGYMFDLTVSNDVKLGDFVVIPKGTPARGEVVWLTGKGAFGKSGKMEIELRHIDLNGRRVPISGRYRQEGEGNTVGTVAGVIAVGVFAAFVTGKSARIPQGRELKAFTKETIPVLIPAVASIPAVEVSPAASSIGSINKQ